MSKLKLILGLDANPHYAFSLPIVAWTFARCGYDVHAFLVDQQRWKDDRSLWVPLELAIGFGLHTEYIEPTEGFRTATVAQCSRVVAAWSDQFEIDDMLTMGDADMAALPGMVQHMAAIDMSAFADISFSNAYHDPFPHWPMTGTTVKAGYMRAVITDKLGWSGEQGMTVSQRVAQLLNTTLGPRTIHVDKEDPEAWWHDEITMSKWIMDEMRRGLRVTMRSRMQHPCGTPSDRVDRFDYGMNRAMRTPPDQCIEFHLPRPLWEKTRWQWSWPAFATWGADAEWMNEYRNQFANIMGAEQ